MSNKIVLPLYYPLPVETLTVISESDNNSPKYQLELSKVEIVDYFYNFGIAVEEHLRLLPKSVSRNSCEKVAKAAENLLVELDNIKSTAIEDMCDSGPCPYDDIDYTPQRSSNPMKLLAVLESLLPRMVRPKQQHHKKSRRKKK